MGNGHARFIQFGLGTRNTAAENWIFQKAKVFDKSLTEKSVEVDDGLGRQNNIQELLM